MPDQYQLGTLSADQIQDADDPAIKIASDNESSLQRDIAAILRKLRDAAALATVTDLVSRLQFYELVQIEWLDTSEAQVKELFNDVQSIYTDAARQASGEIEEVLNEPVVFDPLAGDVNQELTNFRATLTNEIVEQVRQGMIEGIQDGLARGLDADTMAQSIIDGMGLAANQAEAVRNFRRLLVGLDRSALDRTLRDRRFDPTIRAAIQSGEPLAASQVDRMVSRYAERFIQFRAQGIARTESLRAANLGRAAAYEQAVNTGQLGNDDVRRFWLTAQDEMVCPVCRSIPLMNRRGVKLGEPYRSVEGPVMMPPDPHTRCRCSEDFRVQVSYMDITVEGEKPEQTAFAAAAE